MEYLSRVILDVNGLIIEDFKSVAVKEREYHKPVNLMNKTGFMATMPRHLIDVDYVVPATEEPFDWAALKDGRLSLEYPNGSRETFTGVYILKVGEMKADGENETVQSIELGATGVISE